MSLVKSLDDVGTRREHLMDLYEMWSYGIAVLEGSTLAGEGTEVRKKNLEIATDLLWNLISRDYTPSAYIDTINRETHAEDIEDKRGSPLIEPDPPPEGQDPLN